MYVVLDYLVKLIFIYRGCSESYPGTLWLPCHRYHVWDTLLGEVRDQTKILSYLVQIDLLH